MMTIKHLIAGAVVTAAVTSALVLGGAATAQATIYPPKPIGPGSVNQWIYNTPNYPGFHLPAELWTKYGPQVKPGAPVPYSTLPADCASVISPYLLQRLAVEGYVFTGDSTVHATSDSQLLTLLSRATRTITCRWANRAGGGVNLTDAIGIDDAAVVHRLQALGFADPVVWLSSVYYQQGGGVRYGQSVAVDRGGWTLVSTSGSASDDFGFIAQSAADHLDLLNS